MASNMVRPSPPSQRRGFVENLVPHQWGRCFAARESYNGFRAILIFPNNAITNPVEACVVYFDFCEMVVALCGGCLCG